MGCTRICGIQPTCCKMHSRMRYFQGCRTRQENSSLPTILEEIWPLLIFTTSRDGSFSSKRPVFFFSRSPVVVKNIMDASTTFADAVAAIGGTLGGFTGFSVLSFVEIIYFIWGYFAWKSKKVGGSIYFDLNNVLLLTQKFL